MDKLSIPSDRFRVGMSTDYTQPFTQRQLAIGIYEHVHYECSLHVNYVLPFTNTFTRTVTITSHTSKDNKTRTVVQLGNSHFNSAVNDYSAYLNATEKEPFSLDLTRPLFICGVG